MPDFGNNMRSMTNMIEDLEGDVNGLLKDQIETAKNLFALQRGGIPSLAVSGAGESSSLAPGDQGQEQHGEQRPHHDHDSLAEAYEADERATEFLQQWRQRRHQQKGGPGGPARPAEIPGTYQRRRGGR